MNSTRRVLSLVLLLALVLAQAVPAAGAAFCQVRKGDCCGCGPAMQAATCCCHKDSTPAPAPTSDNSARTAPDLMAGAILTAVDGPAAVTAPALAFPPAEFLAPAGAILVPLYVRHAAFLI